MIYSQSFVNPCTVSIFSVGFWLELKNRFFLHQLKTPKLYIPLNLFRNMTLLMLPLVFHIFKLFSWNAAEFEFHCSKIPNPNTIKKHTF